MEQTETMTLLTDIRRYQSSGALPFGASQAEQDAIWWEAVDVVQAETARVMSIVKPEGAGA